jgi:multicomponent Na+:H+ antiporter subunit E
LAPSPRGDIRRRSRPLSAQHEDSHLTTWAGTLPRIAIRTMFVIVLWLVVSEGDLGSLVVGVPLSVIASGVSVRLYPDRVPRLHPVGIVRFIGFFAVQSVLGGVDVALRAFRPSLPLDPADVHYRLRLPPLAPRILFINTVSLLPGTLSAQLIDDVLVIHVLDCSRPVAEELARVEERVGLIFGLDLTTEGGGAR